MSSPTPGPGAPATPPEPTTTPTGQAPAPGLGQVPVATPEADPEIAELRKENANWRKQLRAAQTELEALKAAALPEQEKAIAAARADGAAEFERRWRTAVLTNAALTALGEARAVAVEPALGALDLSDVDIDANGKVDTTAIKAKVDDLHKRYPMLFDGQLPPISSLTGADQRRVTTAQLPRPGDNDRDALNRLARYALGGDGVE